MPPYKVPRQPAGPSLPTQEIPPQPTGPLSFIPLLPQSSKLPHCAVSPTSNNAKPNVTAKTLATNTVNWITTDEDAVINDNADALHITMLNVTAKTLATDTVNLMTKDDNAVKNDDADALDINDADYYNVADDASNDEHAINDDITMHDPISVMMMQWTTP